MHPFAFFCKAEYALVYGTFNWTKRELQFSRSGLVGRAGMGGGGATAII